MPFTVKAKSRIYHQNNSLGETKLNFFAIGPGENTLVSLVVAVKNEVMQSEQILDGQGWTITFTKDDE